MSEQAKLLLDVGNSSVKYAWYENQHIADLQVLRTSIDSLPDLLQQTSACFLCSVKSSEEDKEILRFCEQYQIQLTQVSTQRHEFGIENAYSILQNMGTDRWMAIVAGAALNDQGTANNYLVVDAGTAITCDFVVGNKHIGGWIAPGLQMSRKAVVGGTKRVFDQEQSLASLDLGDDTPACVANGALAQLSGMLLQAIVLMQKEAKKFQIYISGGDAPLLIKVINDTNSLQSPVSINYVENLVLVGLAKIAHEKAGKNA